MLVWRLQFVETLAEPQPVMKILERPFFDKLFSEYYDGPGPGLPADFIEFHFRINVLLSSTTRQGARTDSRVRRRPPNANPGLPPIHNRASSEGTSRNPTDSARK